ncbi:DUF3667 domain-containing protein [Parahaliea maris]|uniref:DUF3667 domain-containing protein n=1 Tax=Parahaliea maris TaxID=2716870 RepID=A0A5C9A1U4_9GAMM|nr:DUF3667 domain-containing protein [Parahaliea maris]TXS94019.1 DUF3667 domain-containing protein [Parahaliea maris]
MGKAQGQAPTDTAAQEDASREVLRCRNCGAALRGEFCHSCGQREGHDLRFLQAVGEITGDVLTWDSRFWRTLFPLLFRPGFLTAEFITGRRARYVPPFRLYLIISFITFLTLSITTNDAMVVFDEDGDAEIQAPLIVGTNGINESADVEQSEEDEPSSKAIKGIDLGIDPNDPSTPRWLARLGERIEANGHRVEKDPNLFLDQLMDSLPQAMFVMLPCFALLLWLFYLFSPFHYLQHLVFALHFHSFLYLLYLLSEGLDWAGLEIGGLLTVAMLAYLPLALRRAYDSSTSAAIAKSLGLYLLYGILLALVLAAVSVTVIALL